MALEHFHLSDPGEGLTEVEIVAWLVAEGDTVAVNDVVAEVETAKSLVELPIPFAGVVAELLVAVGDTVEVGAPLLAVRTEAEAEAEAEAPADEAPTPNLVGYGATQSRTRRRKRTTTTPTTPAAPEPPPAAAPATDTGSDDDDQRIPITGVRKATAQAMVDSAFTAPHVTEWLTVDVSATVALVNQLKTKPEFDGVKLTFLAVVAKALCLVVKRHPAINASWDQTAEEIVIHGAVNLGIATATPRGLLVPNVKTANHLDLKTLSEAIDALVTTARSGRTPPAELTGGTITITNVGVFGVDAGTPILNPGEAAILALGAVRRMPWVVADADGSETIAPRWVTQLALSFDHRLVDGELGSRVLADLGALLHDPGRALAWSA